MSKFLNAKLTASALVLISLSGFTFAHGHMLSQKNKPQDQYQMLNQFIPQIKNLNLTDEQKGKIKTIISNERKQENLTPNKNRVANMEAENAIVIAPQFDEDAAKTLIKKQSDFFSSHQLARLKAANLIYNTVLTPSQQKRVSNQHVRLLEHMNNHKQNGQSNKHD